MPSATGSIEVITGPMFSGKSEELIRRVRRAEIARLKIRVFKHAADDRYSTDHVVSHSEWRIRSGVVVAADEIRSAIGQGVQVVGIDEAQFFGPELLPLVQDLARNGVRVIVVGLDMDYLGRPFGPMPLLLAVAEHVTKLDAVCMQCGSPAHFSQRLVPSSESVLIGGPHMYEARCRRCFSPVQSGSTGASPVPFGDSPKVPTH